MKITIVCGFFLPVPPVAGGAVEKMWWRLARLYVARGHQVTLISRRWTEWPDAEVVEGVRLIRLAGFDHRPKLWQNLLRDAVWGYRVLRALPPADILITNTIALPVVVRALCPAAGKLVVNLNRYPKGQLRWYRGVSRVQAASSVIADAARQQAPRLASVLRVVPNSIDAAGLAKRTFNATDPERPVTIGFFGRIHPEKGLVTLVAATALLAKRGDLPAWRVMLRGPTDIARGGGGDAFVRQLRELAPTLWQEGRISLAEPLFDPVALATAYRELDIFCYPTEAREGEAHPVAVLEAMASGLAVLATDLPCFADQLRADENAALVPAGDPVALAAALADLVRDPVKRARFGEEAHRVVSTLDDRTVADQHLADFETLLNG